MIKIEESLKNYNDSIGVVLGGYINALHVIRNLGLNNIPIICISKSNHSIAAKSKYTTQSFRVDYDSNQKILFETLIIIGKQFKKKAVIFPTSDEHIKIMTDYYLELCEYYYIAVNPDNNDKIISKKFQYEVCSKIGIAYPKSYYLCSIEDINKFINNNGDLLFPLIIKPFKKIDSSRNLFRVKQINSIAELERIIPYLIKNIDIGFLVSEIIPGEPNNLWTYGSYCDEKSNVIAGWSGRKITQRPYYFGVFSTARYEKNEIVIEQGKKLLTAIQHIGLSQVEFKYDYRDNKYKLIEINPRYWMWHGVGIKDGINLALIHYYQIKGDYERLMGLKKEQSNQLAYIVFLASEFINIFDNKDKIKFIKNFLKSLMFKNKIEAVFNLKDFIPTVSFIINNLKLIINKVK